MKKIVSIFFFLLLFVGTSYADIFIEYFSIGPYRLKVVHMNSGDKLIINYFRKESTAQDISYKYMGVEVYQDGKKIKDTFKEND